MHVKLSRTATLFSPCEKSRTRKIFRTLANSFDALQYTHTPSRCVWVKILNYIQRKSANSWCSQNNCTATKMQNHSFSFQFLWDSTFGSYTFWSKSKCSLLIFSVLDVKSNQPTYYTFSKHSTRCKCKPAIHWITSNGFNMSKNEKEQTKKKQQANEQTNRWHSNRS